LFRSIRIIRIPLPIPIRPMRPASSLGLILVAAALLRAPAAAQTPEERMRACEPADPGSPLAGVVTDAATGEPLGEAVVAVDEYTFGLSDAGGCYAAVLQTEFRSGRRRVSVRTHRYVAIDTVLDLSPQRTDTVHFALRPAAPACCRLQGEWSLRLTLNRESRELLESKRTAMEGRIVFSDRLPVPWEGSLDDSLHVEAGRFDLDLLAFFGQEEGEDVELPPAAAHSGVLLAEDFLTHAAGEVLAGDSVMMRLVPASADGGIGLEGHIRGDSVVQGRWLQHGPCCGVGGGFVMRRVAGSAAGDSLVARGVRAMDEAREAARRAEAERRQRGGTLRLRVVDTRTGRYARVEIYAQQGEDHEVGVDSIVSTRADGDGWSDSAEFLSGPYALFVSRYECEGETRIPNTELEENDTPIGRVVVQAGRAAELEMRVDLCAIKAYDFELDDPVKLDPGDYAPPAKSPLPAKP
jgi:hypothetical protein